MALKKFHAIMHTFPYFKSLIHPCWMESTSLIMCCIILMIRGMLLITCLKNRNCLVIIAKIIVYSCSWVHTKATSYLFIPLRIFTATNEGVELSSCPSFFASCALYTIPNCPERIVFVIILHHSQLQQYLVPKGCLTF